MRTDPKAIILMYHRINPTATDPWGMCVSPDHFSGQLAAIKQVATPISLIDFVRTRETGELPERAVVVTFDDGYIDNFEQALPIIRHHEVPATLFVTTCNIDTAREFWWDHLETILLTPGMLPDRLELEMDSGTKVWELASAASYTEQDALNDCGVMAWTAKTGRLGFFYNVWKALWPLADDRRAEVLDQLMAWTGVKLSPSTARRSMTSAEIQRMAEDSLMTIGAHTVDHPPLPAHAAHAQLDQILRSRDQLQAILGSPVTTFAYPHGEFSPETIQLLHDTDFECAVTVQQKLASRSSDAMRLPRFGVKDIDGSAFLEQLNKWFELPVETGVAK